METQAKMQIEQAKAGFEIEKMRNEAELKGVLMDKEFSLQMQIKGVDAELIDRRESQKENRKDDRVKLTKTAESKLVEQRKRTYHL